MSSVGDISLQRKIVVVTGGGSGIHLELCKLAHAEGAKVVIADLKLTEEAKAILYAEIIYQPCDVAKWQDLESIVTVSEEKFGDVPDVYVAGAGAFEPSWSNFWDDTEDESYAAVQININHPLKLTRIATRALLRKDKKGIVLIMASIAGYSGNFAAPMYSTTKHALIGFARSIGELDRLEGIKVVTIAPGIVKTPLWTPEAAARFGYSDAIAISPEEVAQAEMKLIKEGKYSGGTIFEISMAGERTIPTWSIHPPGYDPENLVQGIAVPQEALDRSYEPIREILKKERRSGH